MNGLTRGLAALGILALASRGVVAQGSASISGLAEVATGLTVLAANDLGFGDAFPGVPATVDPQSSASAGKFILQGARRAQIAIDLTLPTELTVGPNSLPVSFGNQAGCHRNRDQQAQCRYFDPTTTLITRIRNRPTPRNLRYVWIGGTINPTAGQAAGIYRGTITLTAAYTGN